MPNTYNRVLGADLELLSSDNRWYSSSYFAKSFDQYQTNNTLSGGAFVRYSVRHLEVAGGSTFVGENFNAEAGFVPRSMTIESVRTVETLPARSRNRA